MWSDSILRRSESDPNIFFLSLTIATPPFPSDFERSTKQTSFCSENTIALRHEHQMTIYNDIFLI